MRHIGRFSACAALASAVAHGQIVIPSDGTDLTLAPTGDIEIDLSLAIDGVWSDESNGVGVYDNDQWAVVFEYESVNIPAGVTVTFKNHPSRAPVIWLVQGDVIIDGVINIEGKRGHDEANDATNSEPGPGGFRGGRGQDYQTIGEAGHGPGGGQIPLIGGRSGNGGSFGTYGDVHSGDTPGRVYGNEQVFPLIGGSGGSGGFGDNRGDGGGAGGGALLIATPGTVALNGEIDADGGRGGPGYRQGGGGSGGGVRIVCDLITGDGNIWCRGGGGGRTGGLGRTRIEANQTMLAGQSVPKPSYGFPTQNPRLFIDSSTPRVRIAAINGQPVTINPNGEMTFPNMDVQLPELEQVPVQIEAFNVPSDSVVTLLVVRLDGRDYEVPAMLDSESGPMSIWIAQAPVNPGMSTMQVYASFPESQP